MGKAGVRSLSNSLPGTRPVVDGSGLGLIPLGAALAVQLSRGTPESILVTVDSVSHERLMALEKKRHDSVSSDALLASLGAWAGHPLVSAGILDLQGDAIPKLFASFARSGVVTLRSVPCFEGVPSVDVEVVTSHGVGRVRFLGKGSYPKSIELDGEAQEIPSWLRPSHEPGEDPEGPTSILLPAVTDPEMARFLLLGAGLNLTAALGPGAFRASRRRSTSGRLTALPKPGLNDDAEKLCRAAAKHRTDGWGLPIMTSRGSVTEGLLITITISIVSQRIGASREEQLGALATGQLVASRACPERQIPAGVCKSLSAGIAGAAAGCARLLGGTEREIIAAVCLATADLASSRCGGPDRGCPLKVGAAARVAIRSARLALEGFPSDEDTGSLDPILHEWSRAAQGNVRALQVVQEQSRRIEQVSTRLGFQDISLVADGLERETASLLDESKDSLEVGFLAVVAAQLLDLQRVLSVKAGRPGELALSLTTALMPKIQTGGLLDRESETETRAQTLAPATGSAPELPPFHDGQTRISPLQREHLLLVESDGNARRQYEEQLKAGNMEVTAFGEGGPARRFVGALRPSLAIIRHKPPVLDGLKILEQLQEAVGVGALPAIVIATGAKAGLRSRALSLGVEEIVTQPGGDLVSLVRSVLARCRSRNPAALSAYGLGKLISDRYRVFEKLGFGGMGIVLKVLDEQNSDIRALKILDVRARENRAVAEQRFAREIDAMKSFAHPNIVPILDRGMSGGSPYYVMPVFNGGSFTDRVIVEPRDIPSGLRDLAIIAEAVQAIHDAEMVHRDIKADNILYDGEGKPHLSDFGLVLSGDDARLTEQGFAVGTAHYMAPELLRDEEEADHRSDIYSLGVLAFQLTTGELPYGDQSRLQVLISAAMGVSPLRPGAEPQPDRLLEFCRAGMASKPGDRIQSARAFAARARGLAAELAS